MTSTVSRRAFLQSTLAATCAVGALPSPSAAAEDNEPLRVCLVSGSLEYKSDESLTAFADYLEANYPARCTRAFRKTDADLPGLESLETADVMLLFTRRLTIDGEQLERIKKYVESGRPVVGVRTASHALQNWLELDRRLLGGNYQGHYGEGPHTKLVFEEKAKGHPIFAGVQPFEGQGSLYKNQGIAPDVDLLLTGQAAGQSEPIAWTRVYKGGRVFYTSLGHPGDFADENFRRMLANALFWAARRAPAKR